MRIPERLRLSLEQDPRLLGAVEASVAEFSIFVSNSGMPLFPEYTDHGLQHIEGVLATVDAVAADAAWHVLSAADAAVLILAVLLHDCAMHIREDGFIALLSSTWRAPEIVGFPEVPWVTLWKSFFAEAERFDNRELQELFGDSRPVRELPLSPSDWTLRDRLLVGEFLRRHHPRLAHEVALAGIPGPGPDYVRLLHVPADIADLAGVVARSHGAPLRAVMEYLKKYYDVRSFKNVHAVFLCGMLRIADFLQVQAERAPAQELRVRQLRSPRSLREWRTHLGVRDIRQTHDDPEALFIDAKPEDVGAFLRLSEWLRGIQNELDTSWAVIGECYGRYPQLAPLGLVIRRVRSNLDDREAFAASVDYVPIQASFTTADRDLLRLLIRPLYGDHPEIGVRELVQNAVDAVRELDRYSQMTAHPFTNDGSRVRVELASDANGKWLTVQDTGIGMTPETLVHYFLRAGATFRSSNEWRERFEVDAHSTVLRSGRFGVGVLAAFLLGDEFEVTTRAADTPASSGVFFRATLTSDALDLKKVQAPPGTTIRIHLSSDTWKRLQPGHVSHLTSANFERRLNWDWYVLRQPQVELRHENKRIQQAHELPEPGGDLPEGFQRIHPVGYDEVHWTYDRHVPALSVNGIRVQDEGWTAWFNKWESLRGEGYRLRMPHLSVFDSDGAMPLNLQRNGLLRPELPFGDQLFSSVMDDLHAFVRRSVPESVPVDSPALMRAAGFTHEAVEPIGPVHPWFFGDVGMTILDRTLLAEANITRLLLLPRHVPLIDTLEIARGTGILFVGPMSHDSRVFLRTVTKPGSGALGLTVAGARILLGGSVDSVVRGTGLSDIEVWERTLLSQSQVERVRADWSVISIGKCPVEESIDWDSVGEANGHDRARLTGILAVWYLGGQAPKGRSAIATKWLDRFGGPLVTYNSSP